jgi:hypothetical protein
MLQIKKIKNYKIIYEIQYKMCGPFCVCVYVYTFILKKISQFHFVTILSYMPPYIPVW